MIITKEYIMEHRTAAGSWTKSQMEALGAGWSAEKGWINRISGNEISEENRIIFEKKLTAKQNKCPRESYSSVQSFMSKVKLLTDDQLKKVSKAIDNEKKRRVDGMS